MKHRVHVYATVRFPVEVEAETDQEAMERALDACGDFSDFTQAEFADEVTAYLVGDNWYDADTQPWTNYKAVLEKIRGQIDDVL